MFQYDTLSQAIADLRARGYVMDFNIAFDKLHCADSGLCLNPSEFEITEFHRFEGNTDPSDEEVVYAVESKDGKLKGIITAGFGTYAEGLSAEMIQKMKMNIRKQAG